MVLYTNNVPQATQTIAFTQPLIQSNFQYLPLFGDVDHNFTGDSSDAQNGYHKDIHLIPQSNPAAILGIMQLYSKTVGGDTQLFTRTGGGGISQLTGYSLGTNGFQYLGGVLLQWGSTSAVASSSSTPITFTSAFASAPYSVQCTAQTNDNSTIRLSILNAPTTAGFTVTHSSTASFTRMYWIAIGRPV